MTIELSRRMVNTSERDLWRYGWVLFSYDMIDDRWTGRDGEGNKYFMRAEDWPKIEYIRARLDDGQSYRIVKPDALRDIGAEMIPLRNVCGRGN